MKISFFETRTRIFSFNLVLRDENENFFFQSRVSRQEREIENHFSWSSEKKSCWFLREFPGSRILAMLWFEYMVEWGLMAFHQSSLRTNEVELSRRDGGRNTLLSYRYSQRFFICIYICIIFIDKMKYSIHDRFLPATMPQQHTGWFFSLVVPSPKKLI